MKKSTIVYLLFCTLFLSSCASHRHFLRADVIGFSNQVATSYDSKRGIFSGVTAQDWPYSLLTYNSENGTGSRNEQAKNAIHTQLKSTPRGDMTAVDYAMVLAAKRVNYVRRKVAKNDPHTKYYIFLLTDGTDTYSTELAKQEHDIIFPKDQEKYEKRVQNKLKHAMGPFAKNQFEVYPMIFLGEDMMETKARSKKNDAQFKEYIDDRMSHFRYSSTGEAPAVIQATDFGTIAKDLRKKFISSSYTFRVPTNVKGKQIRMNFVNRRGVKATLTGTLSKKLFSYVLTDIKLDGIKIDVTSENVKDNGQTLKANYSYDGNAYFTIDDIRYGNDLPYFPNEDAIEQEIEISGIWQLNSEYREDTDISYNTYFVIVMDGSKSLNGKKNNQKGFEKELGLAEEIVDMILDPRKGQNNK